MLYLRKFHQANNGTTRYFCSNKTCTAKVNTSLKNIDVVNERINEYNEHDQANVEQKLCFNKCKIKA